MNGILLLHFTAIYLMSSVFIWSKDDRLWKDEWYSYPTCHGYLVHGFCPIFEAKMTDYGKMNGIFILHVTAILAHGFSPLSEAKMTDYRKMNGNLLLYVTAILAHGFCPLMEQRRQIMER